jgi:hypothetical protein
VAACRYGGWMSQPRGAERGGADPVVLSQYRAKITTVPGSECLWWTGGVAGRSGRERTDGGGHGRFWYARGRVIIAHRFAFTVMHGVDALAEARLLGHRCAKPLCQPGRAEPRQGVQCGGTGASGRSGGTCPTSARRPTRAATAGAGAARPGARVDALAQRFAHEVVLAAAEEARRRSS